MSTETDPEFVMPGFNIALNNPPMANVLGHRKPGFLNGLDTRVLETVSGGICHLTTKRELLMMQVMNMITEKPEWHRKVFDEQITTKWRNEIQQGGQDITPRMMEYLMQELQWKVKVLEETGCLRVFDAGIVRSDTAVSKDVQHALKEAVRPLEDIPEEQKDYHPNSQNKVVNLVHPSLFPLVYGRTRVLPDKIINLDDCLHQVLQGEVIPVPLNSECGRLLIEPGFLQSAFNNTQGHREFSKRFQWLPCDVKLLEDNQCRIVSYINNAHPVNDKALYEVVEKVIARSIPLWEKSLSALKERRILYTRVEYGEHPEPRPPSPDYQDHSPEAREAWDRIDAWEATRPIVLPEPGEFKIREEQKLSLRDHFPDTRLQIIVKLANIELTPEKPTYDGGSWHIEGEMNERICATSIYYYDNENITENTLEFRQRGMTNFEEIRYEQWYHEFLQVVFGLPNDVDREGGGDITQHLGGVQCKEGRLLTFPNTVQHCVSPFSLVDPSKPGHRKILALFLIDPHRRIISTANVPPQRRDWGRDKQNIVSQVLSRLPRELQDMIEDDVYDLMTMEEAKKLRLELMEERGFKSEASSKIFQAGYFNLCEH